MVDLKILFDRRFLEGSFDVPNDVPEVFDTNTHTNQILLRERVRHQKQLREGGCGVSNLRKGTSVFRDGCMGEKTRKFD